MAQVRTPLRWVGLAFLLLTPFAQAQESEELAPEPIPRPILIGAVASVERSLTDIGTMFAVSDREDMEELLTGLIADKAGNLEGIDRKRPFGLMIFLEERLPPLPRPVVFIPIEDRTSFLKTLALAPGELAKVSESHYELRRRRGAVQMRFVEDYALFSIRDENGAFLERPLPNPEEACAALVSRYDAALSLQIRNVSPLLREVFVGMLRGRGEAELQQRDGEPKSAYEARRASGTSTLKLLEQILRDGEQITLGIDSAPDGSRSVVEMQVDALPESEFFKFLKNIGGKPSYFEPLLQSDQNPLSISVSWNMDDREKDLARGFVKSFQVSMIDELKVEAHEGLDNIVKSLQATIDAGHVDFLFQFIPRENREFVLLAGLKILGPQTFATGLRDLMISVDEIHGKEALELDIHQNQGLSVHRVRAPAASSEDLRIYGTHPSIYLGTGDSVFWIGFGGDGVLPAMDTAVESILVATPGTRSGTEAPFQLVFRMLPWLQLPPREHEDPIRREIANEAMDGGADAVRVEFRPSATGGRLRIQFDKGFVKLLGMALGQLYDRSQL